MDIGIVGLGHLGKIHLKLLAEIPDFKITAIYDLNEELTTELASLFQTKACSSYDELLDHCEVVSIVTSTPTHFELAEKAIKKGKHVFLEKPATDSFETTRQLIRLSTEANVTIQVGHVERFNPGFTSVKPFIGSPIVFEANRLAKYNVRGTDVSVVVDLMIHDIDLLLNITQSNIKKISANGSKVISQTVDIANARIEFENGLVANLTANRVSPENVRSVKIFQKNTYITINLLDKTALVQKVMTEKSASNEPEIIEKYITGNPINAIKTELESFYKSIITNTPVMVSLKDAEAALKVVREIELQINAEQV
jgi:predicted dehydrogenase